MSRFRKTIAAVLIGITITQIIGCATIPKEERADIGPFNYMDLETNAHFPLLIQLTAIDGKSPFSTVWNEIRCGPHKVRVQVVWSNWFKDETEINFEASAGSRYVACAIELKPGQDPTSVTIDSKSVVSQMGDVVGKGLLTGAAPLVLPFAIIEVFRRKMDAQKKYGTLSRPFGDCCYVWIENMQTKQVVGGNKPGVTEDKSCH
jgi:hypothetical protein